MLALKKKRSPTYINQIGYISPPDYTLYNHPLDAAQQIYYKMADLIKKKPNIKIIVMPESSYRFSLNNRKDILQLWTQNALRDDISLLIGSLRQKNNKRFNTAFWIKKGDIQHIYDKRHLAPFTEYIPAFWSRFSCFTDLFSPRYIPFDRGRHQDIIFDCNKMLTLEPCICSDLFLGVYSYQKGFPIVVLLNETVFSCQYMGYLMFLYAKYKALELGRDILYVGYQYAIWITRTGETIEIS